MCFVMYLCSLNVFVCCTNMGHRISRLTSGIYCLYSLTGKFRKFFGQYFKILIESDRKHQH